MDIEEYVKENPDVWDAFKKFTIQAAAAGRRRLSARLVVERMRWESVVSEKDREFKINNNIAPALARKMMTDHPLYAGFFETRTKK